jgi:hypothetical protein
MTTTAENYKHSENFYMAAILDFGSHLEFAQPGSEA